MIKKINKDYFEELKSQKRSMGAKVFLVTVAGALTLSGCTEYKVVDIKDNTLTNDPPKQTDTLLPNSGGSTVEEDFTPDKIVKTELSEEMLTIIQTEVSLDNNLLNKFESSVSNIDVKYKYSELFGSEAALNRYKEMKEYDSKPTTYIKGTKLEVSAIRSRILENNKNYLSEYKGNKYSALSSSEFEKIFNIFISGLEYCVQNGTDLGQLDEKLGDLKILQTTANGSGIMTDEDTILAINPTVIATYTSRNPNIDYTKTVVLHETMHFGQINSEHEKEEEGYSSNLGLSYRWDDLKVNPLDYTWYNDGAAEKMMLDQYGKDIDPTVYPNSIKSLDSITLSALVRGDVDEMTISQLSLKTDLEELFKRFNCKNDEDRTEVINMMFSFDITLNQNADFFNAYKEKNGVTLPDRHKYFNSLNASIAQTLTKNFYINLSNYLEKNDAELGDIFSMISVFETEMSRLTKYNQKTSVKENADFIATYNSIQRQFFDVIASHLGLETSDIILFYNAFYSDALSDTTTTSLLDSYEVEYANQILESRSSVKKNTVNEIGESFKIK
jgi:hypothetical protein